MQKSIKAWDWSLKEYPQKINLNVFGTFVCAGGSTMGYKLAGFNHLGGVEIDPKMAYAYRKNHDPKYFYVEDIREFNKRQDLPKELYNLDILDGSPPCTTFSLAGDREATWGKEKKFREGQATQVLDELVYIYCDTVDKLKPKTVILENVPGIVAGQAKRYAIGIYERLTASGYSVQIFSLNSATMGLPQARERIFFIARRNELCWPDLKLDFDMEPVPFGEIAERLPEVPPIIESLKVRMPYVQYGEPSFKWANMRYLQDSSKSSFFSSSLYYDEFTPSTLTSGGHSVYWNQQRMVSQNEYIRMSTFPRDFDFCGNNVRYVCGMSVPPLMTASIARKMRQQWFAL